MKNYLGCIGKTLEGSGLEELMSLMYGIGTSQHVMSDAALPRQ